ncbi:hypothetical protein M408DRAFT_328187 [Serendipita vermifera MAFF 305830]|uniref:Uncharacterized protein n=1 Tax=Serendipita vermifera MAFF 305830 TaxID=933852 RepID=A0A0C2WX25_SERVB|nr:hypothetical protein M408DRAFT_328187 [Serendipita vermifera MAFF 305830]
MCLFYAWNVCGLMTLEVCEARRMVSYERLYPFLLSHYSPCVRAKFMPQLSHRKGRDAKPGPASGPTG